MTLFSGLKIAALSTLLAAAPVLPSYAQAPQSIQAPADAADTAEALFAAAMARPAPRAGLADFKVADLSAMFEGAATLTYTDGGVDAATGAYRLTGVSMTLPNTGDLPLFTADEMLFWNFDAAALAARMKGERLKETLKIFDRVEFIGLQMDVSTYSESLNETLTGILDDPDAQTTQTERMNSGTMALGGLTLHPWTVDLTGTEEDEVFALRYLSALARSFSLDTMLFLDTATEQTLQQTLTNISITSTYPRQLVYGYDRGRIGGMLQTDMHFQGTVSEKPGDTGNSFENLLISGHNGYSEWTGFDLSKLLEWGEKGQMPPVSERDLWSLGRYVTSDVEVNLNDAPVLSWGKMEFTADKFSWFLPEELTIRHEDASINLVQFLKIADSLEPAASPASEDGPSIKQIIDMLETAGLTKLSGDGEIAMRWNPATGKAFYEINGVTDGLFSGATRLEGDLPNFNQIAGLFGKDGVTFDETAFDTLLEDTAFLTHFSTRVTDAGGLDALSKLAIEIAKLQAEKDPSLAMFADSTPEGLRTIMAGLAMFGSTSLSEELPDVTLWAAQLSQFLMKGGSFEISMNPDRAAFEEAADWIGMESLMSSDLVKILALKVIHTPPADAATGAP